MANKNKVTPKYLLLGGNLRFREGKEEIPLFLNMEGEEGKKKYDFDYSRRVRFEKAFYKRKIVDNLILLMPDEWGSGYICFEGSKNFTTSFYGVISEKPVIGKKIEVTCTTQRFQHGLYVKNVVPETIVFKRVSQNIYIFKSEGNFYLCYMES